LDLQLSIICFAFGAVLLTTIISSILVFFIELPQLKWYCLYLWSSTFTLGVTFFWIKPITTDYHSMAAFVFDMAFDIQPIFYIFFYNSVLEITKQKTPRLWLLVRILVSCIVVGIIADIISHLWGTGHDFFYIILAIIEQFFFISCTGYIFYFFLRNTKTSYIRLLISAGIVMFVFTDFSVVFGLSMGAIVGKTMAKAIFSTGVFLEIILFSITMGYLIKMNWEEKINMLRNIENLNYVSRIQIAELEEKKELIRIDEQKKLGQELYDALAATVAAIQMQISMEALKTVNTQLQDILTHISQQLMEVYETIRNKSHQWYRSEKENDKAAFERRIKTMMDSVFSESRYHVEIDIEENALTKLNLDAKANILRIIQESVANILKHANAHNVSVFIYEEPDDVVLTISDDGDGISHAKPSHERGIGLQLIRERVSEMQGKFNIVSDNNGTEVLVMIPS
jgi:signal transduction histidine kinase